MSFWDTSAVVPLLIAESNSPELRAFAGSTPSVVAWWGTPTEVLSAISRRAREGSLTLARAQHARDRLDQLRAAWTEVLPSEQVREHAARLLIRHPLRAADALQLGAALTWVGGRPDAQPFVCLDIRLWEAARSEGFRIVGD